MKSNNCETDYKANHTTHWAPCCGTLLETRSSREMSICDCGEVWLTGVYLHLKKWENRMGIETLFEKDGI